MYRFCLLRTGIPDFFIRTDFKEKDYEPVNQFFMLGSYLNSCLENNRQDASKLMEFQNKIVHQRYVATEAEAREFLHLSEAINEEIRKNQR